MEDIFVEIKSRYADGKNDFVIKREEFETNSTEILYSVLYYLKSLKIVPDRDVLKCEGNLEDLDLSEFERARIKKVWEGDMVRKIVRDETIDKFIEENKEELDNFAKNDLLKFMKEAETFCSEQVTSSEIMEENITLGIIAYSFSQIFENTKFYDKSDSLTFWSRVKEIDLNKKQIENLIVLNRLIGNNKFQLSFLPLYDFNSESEDIIGINVILNIEK